MNPREERALRRCIPDHPMRQNRGLLLHQLLLELELVDESLLLGLPSLSLLALQISLCLGKSDLRICEGLLCLCESS